MIHDLSSNYFVIHNHVSVARQQIENVILVWQQIEQTIIDAWKTTEQMIIRTITKNEFNEMNSWLERTKWLKYLKNIDREQLLQSTAKLNESDELVTH